MNTVYGYGYSNFQGYGFMPISVDDINRRVAPLVGEEFYRFLNDYLDNNRAEEISLIDLEYFKRLDGFGQTVLHWAVVKGNLQVTEFVIQKTESALFDVKRVYDQYTPLHLAIHGANRDVIRTLVHRAEELLSQLETNNFIAARDTHGQTALHIAASKGNLEACQILYEKMDSEQVAFQMDGRQQTALHFAVQGNHIGIINLLLSEDNKARLLLGLADQYNQTALHWAAGKPQDQGKEIVDLIIDRSVVLEEAARKNFFLAQKNHGYTALHLAVHSESNQTISSLINASNTLNVSELVSMVDDYGQTALHWAAGNGNYQACRYLYQAMRPEAISIQMNNEEGGRKQTALHFAVQGTHVDVIRLLVGKDDSQAKDAEPNSSHGLLEILDGNNETALDWAKKHLEGRIKDTIIDLLQEPREAE